jgi:hypothetical protein
MNSFGAIPPDWDVAALTMPTGEISGPIAAAVMVVRSVAVPGARPPPETVTELVTQGGAAAETLTVTVITG